MKKFSLILLISCFGVGLSTQAQDAKILPGILDMQVIEGTEFSNFCKIDYSNTKSTCVMLGGIEMLTLNEIRQYQNKYLEKLGLMGWNNFGLGHGRYFLEKTIPNTNCSERVGLTAQRSRVVDVEHQGIKIIQATFPTLRFKKMGYVCGNERRIK